MRPAAARLLRSLLAVALVAAAASPASAQTADEVRRAEAERDAATGRVADAATDRDAVLAVLLDAIADYDTVTTELDDLVRAGADLTAETAAVEARARELRASARAMVRAAYVGADDDLTLLFSAGSLLDALVGREILDRAAGRHAAVVADLDAVRADLERRRDDLDLAATRTALLRRDAESLALRLADLADAAAGVLRSAEADAVAATARYEVTAAAYEALVNSIGPATAQWRPLVERWFPEDLVWEALAVMQCESGGIPDAVNPLSDATGLFQFLPGTWAYASVASGFDGADPRDPEANVASAAWLVSHSDLIGNAFGPWGPWECRPGGPVLVWPPESTTGP